MYTSTTAVTACKQDGGEGGGRSPILTNIAKDLWEYCLKRKITLTTELLLDNKMGEQECVNQEHKQLEVESKDICSDEFAMGSSRDGPVCGQIKCAAREVHELETCPFYYGNR